MSAPCRPTCVAAALTMLWLSTAIADEPPPPDAVPITFSGVVELERPDVVTLLPICRNLIIAWVCQDGHVIRKGDPVIICDTKYLQREAAVKEYEWHTAVAQLEREELRLQSELATLQEEERTLEAELGVTQAALNRARHVDEDQVALLKAEHERDAQRAADLRRDLKAREELFALGELAAEELTQARLATVKAENTTRLSRLKWKRTSVRIDDLEVAKLELAEQKLLMQLGRHEAVGAKASADAPKRGMARRIEALERQIERERGKNQAALDRARKEHHDAVRDAFDCTPLSFVEVLDPETKQPVRRFTFRPSDAEAPEGYVVDDGSEFDAERGHGWDRDLRQSVHLRDKGEPLQQGVALVRGRAVWRCELPDGEYLLRLGMGDAVDWHGPLVRRDGQVLFWVDHLKEPQVVEQTITITGGQLALVCGDELEKVMRAPGDGVAWPQPWLSIGRRIGWDAWPLAYFCPPEKYKVQALVRQDMVGLLKAIPIADADDAEDADASGEADETESGDQTSPTTQADSAATQPDEVSTTQPAAADEPSDGQSLASLRIAAARQSVTTSDVEMVTGSGLNFNGQVCLIDTTPVKITRGAPMWWWGDEPEGQDLIARQVYIKPDAEDVTKLRLGETVTCRVWIQPGPDMHVLPVHMVAEGQKRFVVTLADDRREVEVEGFRVGQHFFVTGGWTDDTPITAPVGVVAEQRDQRRRFNGQVVAGERVDVGIPHYWGRIKEMVDDGSYVEKDQQIITLYNPKLEVERDKIKEQKVKAEQEYLVAIEQRRVKTVQAQVEHSEKVIDERRARLELRVLTEKDPIQLATARSSAGQAELEAKHRSESYRLYRDSGKLRAAEVETARVLAARAEAAQQRAHIDQVAAMHQSDWLAVSDAHGVWLDTVDALSLREIALRIVRKEEKVSRMKSELSFQQAMEGGWRERVFDRIKDIKAPACGRIFYLTGWNDQARARTKIKKDFVVWGGLPIAQILDMSQLGMEAELPEDLYDQIVKGTEVMVGFAEYPGVEVTGVIDEIGKSFYRPEDEMDTAHGDRAVSLRRVFEITVRFSPPARVADRLVPGTKGYVYLP